MKSKPINLSKEFDFFFTFPFNLGFSIEYISSPFYLFSLERVAPLLDISFPKYSWSMEQFDENLPLSLRNKGGERGRKISEVKRAFFSAIKSFLSFSTGIL